MKKIMLFAFVLGVFLPVIVFAQTPLPSLIPVTLPGTSSTVGDSEAGSFLSNLPLVQGLKMGKILLNPSFQVGYQHITANMSIPISADVGVPAGQLQIGTVDVSLKNFDFWSGTLGLNVIAGPITLFGSWGGFSPRLFQFTGETPISVGLAAAEPILEMSGTNFQFWVAQVGAAYTFKKGYSILGGFLWNQTEFQLTDPRIGSVPLDNQTLRGDVLMQVYVPFLGIQVMQEGVYRGALLYSPVAWSSGALDLRTSTPILSDLRYSLNQPGNFAAFTAEYYLLFKPPVTWSLWFTGSLVSIKGNSNLQFTTAAPDIVRTRDVTITNTQYLVGGGVTLGLVF
ncbi:MAG: hypothetical protein ACLQPD_01790 [Desulfomonilaceae bacterium]